MVKHLNHCLIAKTGAGFGRLPRDQDTHGRSLFNVPVEPLTGIAFLF